MSSNQKKSPLAIKSNLKAGFNSHAQERAPAFVVTQASTKHTHYAQLIK
jgi:hypothetical protein